MMAQSSEETCFESQTQTSPSQAPISSGNENIVLNENSPTTATSQGELEPTLVANKQTKQLATCESNKYENSILIEDDSDEDIIILSPSPQGKATSSGQNPNGKRQPQVELDTNLEKKLHTTTSDTNYSEKIDASLEEKVEKVKVFPARTRVLKAFWGPNLKKTKVLALDCEMAKVEGNVQEVVRCSIINYDGHVIFDHLIKPSKRVIDYVTWIHGILPVELETCKTLEHYQKRIFEILQDSIIVGHSLKGDLDVIGFQPEKENIRDLAKYAPMISYNCPISLKNLVAKYLHVDIQKGAHNSVEDARAAMALYRKFQDQWEKYIKDINQI